MTTLVTKSCPDAQSGHWRPQISRQNYQVWYSSGGFDIYFILSGSIFVMLAVAHLTSSHYGECFSHTSTMARAPVIFSLDATASTHVASGFLFAGLYSAVVPVFADLGAGHSSGADVAPARRSPFSVIPTSFTLFGFFVNVIPLRSLLGGTGDANASDIALFSSQVTVARRRRDPACHDLAPIRSELPQLRDKNDELLSAFALYHGLFRESHLFLLALMSQLDAIMLKLSSSDDMHGGFS